MNGFTIADYTGKDNATQTIKRWECESLNDVATCAYSIPRADLSIGSSRALCSGDPRNRDTMLRLTDQTITTPSSILHQSRTLYIWVGIGLSREGPEDSIQWASSMVVYIWCSWRIYTPMEHYLYICNKETFWWALSLGAHAIKLNFKFDNCKTYAVIYYSAWNYITPSPGISKFVLIWQFLTELKR